MAKKKTVISPEAILDKIDKELDTSCVVFDEITKLPRLDTGVEEFNDLLEGGWVRGRILEMLSIENVGKTSLSLETCGHVQARFLAAKEAGKQLKCAEFLKAPGRAAFLDVEKKYDPYYAKTAFGLIHPRRHKKTKKVEDNGYLVWKPKSAEKTANLIEKLVRSCLFDIIVVDSAKAMCPQDELDTPVGTQHRQKQARILSQHIRKVANYVEECNTALLWLNQTFKYTDSYGNEFWESFGVRAFKHYACVRVLLARGPKIKVGEEVVGHMVKAYLKKNQAGAKQWDMCSFRFYHGEGFCKYSAVLEKAIAFNVIEKKGTWFNYKGKGIGQGWKKLRDFCKQYTTTFQKIKAEVEGFNEGDEGDDYEFSDDEGELEI